jgi:hypothetical protein
MPGDNTGTIAQGAAVEFPQNGAASVSGISRNGGASPSDFILSTAGTYEVFWQVSIAEAGQLELWLNGVRQPQTVAGRATGTSQITNHVLIETITNAHVTIRNPTGNPVALTLTTNAGGASPVSATLLIKQIQ